MELYKIGRFLGWYYSNPKYCKQGVNHKATIVIGKDSGHVQSFAVMLVRLVDTGRERLRQGVDSGNVVYVTSFNKTRYATPVIYKVRSTKTL